MELKRVLFNKKTLIAFIFLIAVCVGLYLNSEHQYAKLFNGKYCRLVLAFLSWFIILFIQSKSISLGIAGIIFAVEFSFYKFLPIQSNIAVLKCLNLFYFINPMEDVIRYCNLNSFFFVINLFWLVVISAIIAALLFASLSILIAAKKISV